MFAVRVVFWRKGFKLTDQVKNLELLESFEGQDARGKHNPTSLKGLSRQIIQRCDLSGPRIV